MNIHTNDSFLSGILLGNDLSIEFETIEECIEFKQDLIAFIKQKKRDVRDRGIEPKLIFNIKTNKDE